MSTPDEATQRTMHRWFAVECNNRGWDLAALDSLNESEEREMLQCAYAAAYHWAQVGQPINDARADTLLAQAHACLGHPDLAMHHARRALSFCESHPCEPWDLAIGHAMMTHAAGVAGDRFLRDHHHAEALRLSAKFTESGDREQFASELQRIETRIAS